jgi:polysaccharide deacetylase family protein (PEP-CTERM system associated)
MTGQKKHVLNAITVDVEDWFQVSVFRNVIDYRDWGHQESRIIPNICRILRLFEEYRVKGTFFILGWIAQRYPEIVLTIKKYGHDIGSHSYSHRLIYEMSRNEFADDLDRSISALEDVTREKVRSYRAPSYSITQESLWALEILSERGIRYDSSIFPVKHDVYGMAGVPRFPFRLGFTNGNKIIEFPLSTIRVCGGNMPIVGGGYLRLFPFWFIRSGIRQLNKSGKPAIVYFHPWELDPHQPRIQVKFTSRFRHYSNLEATEGRLRRLLSEFQFASIEEALELSEIKPWPNYA